MDIFSIESDVDNFQPFEFTKENLTLKFDGTPRLKQWRPIEILPVIEDDEFSTSTLGDALPTITSSTLILSQRVVNVLGNVLQENGELLPLISSFGKYYAYNVTNLSSALDISKSEIIYFSTGRVMTITKYEFDPTQISRYPIFKLVQSPTAPIFITDKIANLIESEKLTGLVLTKVWAA